MNDATTLAYGKLFHLPIVKSLMYSVGIIVLSLFGGIVGYHYLANLSWVDSLLNAAMILTGMGPVNPMLSTSAKLFSSFYALFSGIVFLTTIAVFISPVLHRFMATLHMDEGEKEKITKGK